MKKYTKNKRGIGDNSDYDATTFSEYVVDALESAITYITKVAEKNVQLSQSIDKIAKGKNNLQRGIALNDAMKYSKSVANDVRPVWFVLDAILKGDDIHSGFLKKQKLKLCDEIQNFGNFIANSSNGEADESVRQAIADGKESARKDIQNEKF